MSVEYVAPRTQQRRSWRRDRRCTNHYLFVVPSWPGRPPVCRWCPRRRASTAPTPRRCHVVQFLTAHGHGTCITARARNRWRSARQYVHPSAGGGHLWVDEAVSVVVKIGTQIQPREADYPTGVVVATAISLLCYERRNAGLRRTQASSNRRGVRQERPVAASAAYRRSSQPTRALRTTVSR
jgi:hypothetical protein